MFSCDSRCSESCWSYQDCAFNMSLCRSLCWKHPSGLEFFCFLPDFDFVSIGSNTAGSKSQNKEKVPQRHISGDSPVVHLINWLRKPSKGWSDNGWALSSITTMCTIVSNQLIPHGCSGFWVVFWLVFLLPLTFSSNSVRNQSDAMWPHPWQMTPPNTPMMTPWSTFPASQLNPSFSPLPFPSDTAFSPNLTSTSSSPSTSTVPSNSTSNDSEPLSWALTPVTTSTRPNFLRTAENWSHFELYGGDAWIQQHQYQPFTSQSYSCTNSFPCSHPTSAISPSFCSCPSTFHSFSGFYFSTTYCSHSSRHHPLYTPSAIPCQAPPRPTPPNLTLPTPLPSQPGPTSTKMTRPVFTKSLNKDNKKTKTEKRSRSTSRRRSKRSRSRTRRPRQRSDRKSRDRSRGSKRVLFLVGPDADREDHDHKKQGELQKHYDSSYTTDWTTGWRNYYGNSTDSYSHRSNWKPITSYSTNSQADNKALDPILLDISERTSRSSTKSPSSSTLTSEGPSRCWTNRNGWNQCSIWKSSSPKSCRNQNRLGQISQKSKSRPESLSSSLWTSPRWATTPGRRNRPQPPEWISYDAKDSMPQGPCPLSGQFDFDFGKSWQTSSRPSQTGHDLQDYQSWKTWPLHSHGFPEKGTFSRIRWLQLLPDPWWTGSRFVPGTCWGTYSTCRLDRSWRSQNSWLSQLWLLLSWIGMPSRGDKQQNCPQKHAWRAWS